MYFIEEIHTIKIDAKNMLLVNLLNAAADVVSHSTYSFLLEKQFDKLSDVILAGLVDRRYLFKSKTEYGNFIKLIDETIEKNEKNSIPSFLLVPTYACNLECTYCYEKTYAIEHRKIYNSSEIMEKWFSFIEDIIDRTRSSHNKFSNKDVMVTLMGGEPLLKKNKKLIENILKELSLRKLGISVVTNGVDLHEFIDIIIKYDVSHIQVTLDGSQEIHDSRRLKHDGSGSFREILYNIAMAIDFGITVVLRVNVDEGNIGNLCILSDLIYQRFGNNSKLKPYIYLMQDGGCSGDDRVINEQLAISRISDLEKQYPSMAIFEKRYHPSTFVDSIFLDRPFQPSHRHCGASKNLFILDFKGDVYKCWHGIGNKKYRVGFIHPKREFNENLKIWGDRSVENIHECQSCNYRYICGTGCPAAGHKNKDQPFDISSSACVDYENILTHLIQTKLAEIDN